jgi:hypothetical protein
MGGSGPLVSLIDRFCETKAWQGCGTAPDTSVALCAALPTRIKPVTGARFTSWTSFVKLMVRTASDVPCRRLLKLTR